MSLASVAAAIVLVLSLAGAAVIIRREARASGLGLVHPGVAWLALHVVFFGIGGAALALTDGAGLQAVYTGLAAAAFAGGLGASAALARRRGADSAPDGSADAMLDGGARTDVRWLNAIVLAVLSILLVVPTLLRTGLPFLVADITGSRVELTGLLVQPLRVALPAIAASAVTLVAFAGRSTSGDPPSAGRARAVVLAVAMVGAIGVFDLLLASRYFIAELAAAVMIGWLLGGGRLRARAIAVVIVGGLAVFAGIGLFRAYGPAQGRELSFLLERTVNRVLMVQPQTLDAIMTAVPADHPFFLGLGWMRRLGPLLGQDIPNLGYWIYPQVVGDPQVVAGYAAPGLIGEAWANFGWAGLVLFAALGVVADRLAALIRLCRGQADRVAATLLVLFLARTHALGLGGLTELVVLVAAWRLLVARPAGLDRSLRATLRWRAGGA